MPDYPPETGRVLVTFHENNVVGIQISGDDGEALLREAFRVIERELQDREGRDEALFWESDEATEADS